MENGYENAPATGLLATHCCACGRALCDALSVELGIGPVCRERNGFNEPDAQFDGAAVLAHLDGLVPVAQISKWTARQGANALVHRIAARPDAQEVPELVNAVDALGFTKLARTLRERLVKVEKHACVTITEETRGSARVYAVRAECLSNKQFTDLQAHWRTMPGAWWDCDAKARIVPVKQRVSLWMTLRAVLRGVTLVSAKGSTTL